MIAPAITIAAIATCPTRPSALLETGCGGGALVGRIVGRWVTVTVWFAWADTGGSPSRKRYGRGAIAYRW